MTRKFILNGEQIEVSGKDKYTLLRLLRDELSLTGTKCGCKTGDCGSCTVLIDGINMRSCLILTKNIEGKNILTIEGVEDTEFKKMQDAFKKCGGVQCGFCTPGMIMAGIGILKKNPHPNRSEIRDGLKYNLCRCTGYEKIVDAIYVASGGEHNRDIESKDINIGKDSPVDLVDRKVSGSLEYTDDMYFKGALVGKMIEGPSPHGILKSMDISKALEVPGVKCILTALDDEVFLKDMNSHITVPYEEIINNEKIFNKHFRFHGDRVGAIAATTEEAATRAISLISFEYEKLPPVIGFKNSLEGDTFLHGESNIADKIENNHGSIPENFKGKIIKNTYKTDRQSHGMMEPGSVVADFDGDKMVIYCPCQNVFNFRYIISELFELPQNKVRIKKTPVGGAFGARSEMVTEAVAAALSFKTKKPVKITMTRREQFLIGRTRAPFEMKMEMGVLGGKINYMKMEVLQDRGAYFGSAYDLGYAWMDKIYKIYKVKNVIQNSTMIYSTAQSSGAVRGYGNPKITYAREDLINRYAREAGVDKIQFRLDNMVENGDVDISIEKTLSSVGSKPTLLKLKELIGEVPYSYEDEKYYYGIGVVASVHGNGVDDFKPDYATALVKMNQDGSAIVYSPAHDIGQGSGTMIRKIVGEVLTIDENRISVLEPDTDVTFYSNGAYATRETFISGMGAMKAAEVVKDKLLKIGGELLGVTCNELKDGRVIGNGKSASFREVISFAQMRKPSMDIEGIYHHSIEIAAGAAVANGALVRINKLTKEIKVLKIYAVHDVGKKINPMLLEGQIEGGIQMGLGLAFSENIVYDEESGKCKTLNFKKYKMFRASEMPEMIISCLENNEQRGPFGAKGIGEVAVVGVAGAIVDAIEEAIKIDINSLPIKSI